MDSCPLVTHLGIIGIAIFHQTCIRVRSQIRRYFVHRLLKPCVQIIQSKSGISYIPVFLPKVSVE